jgi:hypothetical protein
MDVARPGNIYTLLFTLILGAASSMAHGVEEPEFAIIGDLGDVEIRSYEAAVQAVTILRDSGETTQGFRRLAGFIFGGNDAGQKIAMTAPVQETLDADHPQLAFTMPAGYSMETLPVPDDPAVSLNVVPARTVAVISFSGWATPAKVRNYTRQLQQVLESHNIEYASDPMLNQYNPPWTLPFLRRNEIIVEVERPELLAGGLLYPATDAQKFKF